MVPGHPRVLVRHGHPAPVPDAGYTRQIAAEIYGGTARDRPAARIVDVLHPWTRVGPSRGYLYQLAAGAGWTSLPLLPLVRQPTLILAGDDDPIIPLINARVMAG